MKKKQLQEFLFAVEAMRKSQKKYFKTKLQSALNESKAGEKKVDAYLKQYIAEITGQGELIPEKKKPQDLSSQTDN